MAFTETRPSDPNTVDALVDATPDSRERTIDLVRVACIVVVVLWHWVFSITQWSDHGQLVMPNLISHVHGLWAATWVLQIMPAFFIVGGYANLASWQRAGRTDGALVYWRRRSRRLLRPAAALLAVWAALDAVLVVAGGRQADVLHWGMVTFVPLWFLGVYLGVVLLVPFTARLHERFGLGVPIALVAGMVVAGNGLMTTGLVWVFAHQLGYFWRDGSITGRGRNHERRAALALVASGVGALGWLTTVGGYPSSMVATAGETGSNMFPTTICIGALAVFQLGLLLLARPALEHWLRRRTVWRVVVAANGIAMTVFCWHMTADVAVIQMSGALGIHLLDRLDTAWWAWRPFWLLAPGIVLAGLVAVFSRIERS